MPDDAAEKLRQFRALAAVSATLASPGAIEQRLRTTAQRLRRHLRIERVIIHALEGRETIRTLAVDVRPGSLLVDVPLRSSHSTRVGATGLAVRSRKPVIVNDYATFTGALSDRLAVGVRSVGAFPLRANRRIVGVLTIVSARADYFTPSRVQLFELIAGNLGTLLTNALLVERQRGQTAALRQAMEQLNQSQETNIHLGRIAAMGELVAAISHELRAPLTAVAGWAELGLAQRSDEERTKALTSILTASRGMMTTLQRLLDFARQNDASFEPMAVTDALEGSLALLAHHLAQRNITVTKDLPTELPLVAADRQQLEQVFINVIINAEQAMVAAHDGGTLAIKAEASGGNIRLSFTDDGPGIPASVLPRIFNAFYTTKQLAGGTGLGLNISSQIIKRHGGNMGVDSPEGEGATFWIELPVWSPR